MTQEERTNMERLVLQAMQQAGIPPGAPVMLGGHSQGGIIAASLASDAAVRGQYNIRAVVTEGSPIGRHPIPDDIRVLAIENAQDPVPKLDGESNRATGRHTTVTHDLGDGGSHVIDAHQGEQYKKTVEAIDRGTGDPSTDAAVDSFRSGTAEFTGDATVSSYDLKRT
jgi:pimeloyl-ACP methyl ester carboxylesterase